MASAFKGAGKENIGEPEGFVRSGMMGAQAQDIRVVVLPR